MKLEIDNWIADHSQMPPRAALFFSCITDRRFLTIIESLLNREDVAVSESYVWCCFEENFDPVEHEIDPTCGFSQPFSGVRFSFQISYYEPFEFDVVTHDIFLEYLREACRGYCRKHPELKVCVEMLFLAKGLSWQV